MRVFVALRPPAAVLADLPDLGRLGAGLRPVRLADVHLTLAFLGEVAGVEELTGALDLALIGQLAPRLRLSGAGRFAGGACWLGLAGELAGLRELVARVRGAARSAGLAVDPRPWRAHLTIGRGAALPAALSGYSGPSHRWREVSVVHSRPRPEGACYRDLRRWRLAARPAPGPGSGPAPGPRDIAGPGCG